MADKANVFKPGDTFYSNQEDYIGYLDVGSGVYRFSVFLPHEISSSVTSVTVAAVSFWYRSYDGAFHNMNNITNVTGSFADSRNCVIIEFNSTDTYSGIGFIRTGLLGVTFNANHNLV